MRPCTELEADRVLQLLHRSAREGLSRHLDLDAGLSDVRAHGLAQAALHDLASCLDLEAGLAAVRQAPAPSRERARRRSGEFETASRAWTQGRASAQADPRRPALVDLLVRLRAPHCPVAEEELNAMAVDVARALRNSDSENRSTAPYLMLDLARILELRSLVAVLIAQTSELSRTLTTPAVLAPARDQAPALVEVCATACDLGRQLARSTALAPTGAGIRELGLDLAFGLARAVQQELDRVVDFDFDIDLIHALVRALQQGLGTSRGILHRLTADSSRALDAALTEHVAALMGLPALEVPRSQQLEELADGCDANLSAADPGRGSPRGD